MMTLTINLALFSFGVAFTVYLIAGVLAYATVEKLWFKIRPKVAIWIGKHIYHEDWRTKK